MSAEVQKADPRHNQLSLNPVEYEWSNGRKFRGYYKKRGAYDGTHDEEVEE